ncbi:MAG: MOSC domain-containing protein [Candidatus Acidiferrales bacterium]
MVPGFTIKGQVAALFISPLKGAPMQTQQHALARAGHGLDGCAHARPGGSRQVLLIDSETLQEFGVAPGALKENITTAGLDVPGLAPGTRLRLGEAVLEITKLCTPCAFVDKVQPGLREKLQVRRGMLARVLEGGAIQVGDAIEVVTG